MSWMETWALVNRLSVDRSSHLCAALNGWDRPFSQEATILADLYDVTVRANTDRKKRAQVKPYPRPWPLRGSNRSKKPTVSQATVRAALAARGH